MLVGQRGPFDLAALAQTLYYGCEKALGEVGIFSRARAAPEKWMGLGR